MPVCVKFYPAGCGDAIRIRFWDGTRPPINVFIDSGFLQTYRAFIHRDILNFAENEKIDLWIVTHIDEDHINGVVGFFRALKRSKTQGLLEKMWFNCFEKFSLTDDSSTKSGIDKAIEVREYLETEGMCPETVSVVTNELEPIEIGDAKLTVLSPDVPTYEQLEEAWQMLEEEYWEKKAKKVGDEDDFPEDDGLTIDDLAKRTFIKENISDIANKSSIAVLFEHPELSIVLLGDAHPSVVINSLDVLNAERGCILEVDYIKLSHHASRRNFNKDLLSKINCSKFIISSCASGCDGLPNKETLAKILVREDRSERIIFYFNYDNKRLRNLFEVDADEIEDYNFECVFPDKENGGLLIEAIEDGE